MIKISNFANAFPTNYYYKISNKYLVRFILNKDVQCFKLLEYFFLFQWQLVTDDVILNQNQKFSRFCCTKFTSMYANFNGNLFNILIHTSGSAKRKTKIKHDCKILYNYLNLLGFSDRDTLPRKSEHFFNYCIK